MRSIKFYSTLFYSILIIIYNSVNAAFVNPDELGTKDESTKLYESAYNNILDEKWEDAIKSMEEVIDKFSDSRWYDDARFWQCYAQEQLEKSLEQVFECYLLFIDDIPNSNYTDDVKTNLIRVGNELAEMGKTEYLEQLELMKESEDNEIVISAIGALRNMEDDKALKTLINIYKTDQSRKIKEEIIYILSDFDNPEARVKLMTIAKNDPDDEVREKAIYWLADNSPNEETILFLEDLVQKDKNQDIRKRAVYALSELPQKQGIKSLKNIALKNPDPEIREKAVYWLGEDTDSKDIIIFLEDIVANDKSQHQNYFWQYHVILVIPNYYPFRK